VSTQFSKGPIVNSRYVASTTRPVKGLVAFARAATMRLLGACRTALFPTFPTSCHRLGRHGDPVHPGEESA